MCSLQCSAVQSTCLPWVQLLTLVPATQGLLKLLNVQTGIEQISEIEFALTFLFILFLTEDFTKSSNDSTLSSGGDD